MHDGANEPAAVPAAWKRSALLLGIGGSVGLALGILLTIGVYATYTLITHTLPSTRDSMLVFNELNELRQQINEMNDEKKLQEKEKEEAVRQELSAVASTVRPPDSGPRDVASTAMKQSGEANKSPVKKPQDPFAEIDGELRRLEQTQTVLNTILDILSTKNKERAKDR